jgi:hypothetical protein|tara:strand:- start:421 stop:777 length:357 start_codon:yes stop_codon:yes gene_type:complete
MNMKLKEMKAFAALTDEERATAIRREEARLKAIEDYADEPYQPDRYGSARPECGCGDSYWSLNGEGQQALNICFDSDGTIGSDMWEMICMSHLYCINCSGKPKPPQSYIDVYIAEVEE